MSCSDASFYHVASNIISRKRNSCLFPVCGGDSCLERITRLFGLSQRSPCQIKHEQLCCVAVRKLAGREAWPVVSPGRSWPYGSSEVITEEVATKLPIMAPEPLCLMLPQFVADKKKEKNSVSPVLGSHKEERTGCLWFLTNFPIFF